MDYEDYYEVSNKGRVRNKNTLRILKEGINNRGYHKVELYKNKTKKTLLVHRLVALAFIKKDDNSKNQVNHIDSNKNNNTIDNLEWVNQSENIKHSYKYGNRKVFFSEECCKKRNEANKNRLLGKKSLNSKKVAQIDLKTNKVIKVFDNCYLASLEMNCNPTSIQEVARGKKNRHSTKGYGWKYIKE